MKLTEKKQKILLLAGVFALTLLLILGIVWIVKRGREPATPEPVAEVTTTEAATETEAITETEVSAEATTGYPIPSFTSVPLDVPPVEPSDTALRVEAESAEVKGQLSVEDIYPGYSGEGYLTGFCKNASDSVRAVFSVPAAQHYDVTISVCADTPVTNALMLNDKKLGDFQIEETGTFVRVTFSGIYLPKGEATLSIQEIDGYFSLDYFELTDYGEMYGISYGESYSLSDPDASAGAKQLMAYLSENYGKKCLSGQYTAGDADTELELLHRLTGKYPAIRFGDVEGYTENSRADGGDVIAACRRWAQKGGIAGLMWYWDAPRGVSSVYAKDTDFSLMDALPPHEVVSEVKPAAATEPTETAAPSETAETPPATAPAETAPPETVQRFQFSVDVALMTPEQLDALVKEGTITENCRALLADIDTVSEALKPLAEADIPVLWRPLHEGSGDWFWWGASGPQAYRWLWDVLYRRMTQYHKLHNLIWIWNGQSAEYLVDKYDIASVDRYLEAGEAFGSGYEEFVSLSRMTGGKKMLALSECSSVPSRNQMFRDHTIWSFFGLWYGDYLIDEKGKYSERYTGAEEMIAAYNSEAVLTLDDTAKVFGSNS